MVALALQREDTEQVVEGIQHVGARLGARAVGHPVQAQQPHHVIDAQRTGRSHVSSQRGDERSIRRVAKAIRNEWRQSPVLAGGLVDIGRRADGCRRRIQTGIRPALRAARVDPYREVLEEADTQASPCHARRCGVELRLELPLKVGIELDALDVLRGEARRALAVRVPKAFGPSAPVGGARQALGAERFRQRIEERVAAQGLATGGEERLERCVARIVSGAQTQTLFDCDSIESVRKEGDTSRYFRASLGETSTIRAVPGGGGDASDARVWGVAALCPRHPVRKAESRVGIDRLKGAA